MYTYVQYYYFMYVIGLADRQNRLQNIISTVATYIGVRESFTMKNFDEFD